MSGIVKIDGEVFSTEDFITVLKLNGRFEQLMEDILKDQLTVRAARKQGITLSDEEVQERADQFRRVHGLHRARDANDYFDALGLTLEDFERFITDSLYQDEKTVNALAQQTIIGRNGEMDDLSGLTLFLASRASDYLTGQTLFLDGGWSAK